MIALTLYSRPGCHLCDDMRAVIARVACTIPVTLQEVDISTDAELEARYGGARGWAKSVGVSEESLARLEGGLLEDDS